MSPDEARAIREGLGLTQQDLGILMGFSPNGAKQNWYKFEKGVRKMTYLQVHLLRAISRGYDPRHGR